MDFYSCGIFSFIILLSLNNEVNAQQIPVATREPPNLIATVTPFVPYPATLSAIPAIPTTSFNLFTSPTLITAPTTTTTTTTTTSTTTTTITPITPPTPAYVPLTTAFNELIKYFVVVLKCNTTNNTNINNITTDNTSPCFNDDDDYDDIMNMTWTQINEVLKLNQYEFFILSMKNYPYWNDSTEIGSVKFKNITVLSFMIKTLSTYAYNNTIHWLTNQNNYITIPRKAGNLATQAYVTSWHKEYDYPPADNNNNKDSSSSNNNNNSNKGSSSSNNNNNSNNDNLLGLIAIPFIVVLIVATVILIVIYLRRKNHGKQNSENPQTITQVSTSGQRIQSLPLDTDYDEINTNSYEKTNLEKDVHASEDYEKLSRV